MAKEKLVFLKLNVFLFFILGVILSCLYSCNGLFEKYEEIPSEIPTIEDNNDSLLIHYADFSKLDSIIDLSGNENKGEFISGIQEFAGEAQEDSKGNAGSYLSFRGYDRIKVHNFKLDSITNFTLSFWIRGYANRVETLWQGDQNVSSLDQNISFINNSLYIGNTPVSDLKVNKRLTDGNWHMLTISISKQNSSQVLSNVYIDENQLSINENYDLRLVSDANVFIANAFDGDLDNFRFYNKILSGSVIRDLYQEERMNFTNTNIYSGISKNLISYYSFDTFDSNDEQEHSDGKANSVLFREGGPKGNSGIAAFSQNEAKIEISYSMIHRVANFSVSWWIKFKEPNGTMFFQGENNSEKMFWVGVDSTHLFLGWNRDTFSLQTDTSFRDNNWHMVTLVYQGTVTPDGDWDNVTLFIDAKDPIDLSRETRALPSFINSEIEVNTLLIGNNRSDYRFIGSIDNIRFYNKALSISEITDIFEEESN